MHCITSSLNTDCSKRLYIVAHTVAYKSRFIAVSGLWSTCHVKWLLLSLISLHPKGLLIIY